MVYRELETMYWFSDWLITAMVTLLAFCLGYLGVQWLVLMDNKMNREIRYAACPLHDWQSISGNRSCKRCGMPQGYVNYED